MNRRSTAQFELPARPGLLVSLSDVVSQPDSTLEDVARLIQADPGLAAAVLKTVNSPYYGLASPVSSIEGAVGLLGLAEIHALSTAVLLRNAFPDATPEIGRLWTLSAQVAERAGRLAQETKACPRDIAYTYGLFRYIGCAVMLRQTPGYRSTYAEGFDKPAYSQLERLRHGVHSGHVSSSLSTGWGMSRTVNEALLHYCDSELLPYLSIDEGTRKLIGIATLAELDVRANVFENPTRLRATCEKVLGLGG